MVGELISY